MRTLFSKRNFITALIVYLCYFLPLQFPCSAEEPDSKSIPKPILMLGLYCNSAMSTLKGRFKSNPSAPPWRAEGASKDAILGLLQKLDLNDLGYAKAVKDKALTPGEAQFLKFSAVHEADHWLNNITKSCANPSLTAEEYDLCLKETNSETYKCYRQIIDAAKIITKSKGIK
jgi:hypothetical protein